MKKIEIVGVCIALIVVALAIAFFIVNTPGLAKPAQITVSGKVTTVGTGTSPTLITFTSRKDYKTYVVAVSGGNPGSYSISLPNLDSYSVKITWKFLGITGGSANAGTLNLDTYNKSVQNDWSG